MGEKAGCQLLLGKQPIDPRTLHNVNDMIALRNWTRVKEVRMNQLIQVSSVLILLLICNLLTSCASVSELVDKELNELSLFSTPLGILLQSDAPQVDPRIRQAQILNELALKLG